MDNRVHKDELLLGIAVAGARGHAVRQTEDRTEDRSSSGTKADDEPTHALLVNTRLFVDLGRAFQR